MPEMTIEDLAERSGLTRQTIGNIETGRNKQVALTTILAIARALDVMIDDLIPATEKLSQVAENQAIYGKKERTEGHAFSRHDSSGTSGKGPGVARSKRRAG